MRFDIRVDGKNILCHDDAASVIYLLSKADGIFSVIRRGPSSNEPDINVGDPEFAALIARAVNNHDQLLAACEAIDAIGDQLIPTDGPLFVRASIAEKLLQVRAAIAAATT